jgi:hypothetical protein
MASEFYNWADDEPDQRTSPDYFPAHVHRVTSVPARMPTRQIDVYNEYADAHRAGVPSFYQPQQPVIIQQAAGPLEKVIALILGTGALAICAFIIVPLMSAMLLLVVILGGMGVLALLMVTGGIGAFWNGFNGYRVGRHVGPRNNRDHTRT